MTGNLSNRLREHNKGYHSKKYTRKQAGSWELMYSEPCSSRSEAAKRELTIKVHKSRKYIEELIQNMGR